MAFTESDLNSKYNYTKKRDKGDGKPVGHPDRDLLDKNEAYEMVDFINHALKTISWTVPLDATSEKTAGKKIERLVKDHAPDIRSRSALVKWVWEHYNITP